MDQGVSKLSRRKFLRNAGGITFILSSGALIGAVSSLDLNNIKSAKEFSAWVTIHPDGSITIMNPAAEMGQGSMTALAAIIADEMDAEWKNVTIQDSPIEPDIYGLQWSGQLGGPMITVGSRTVRGYYKALRLAGAQIRQILISAAADKWEIEKSMVTTKSGKVLHPSSQKQLSYGEIADFIQLPYDLPEITENDLKDPDTFNYIGQEIARFDIPDKVKGAALYSIDVRVPGILYGMISRSPVNGAKPSLVNATEIQRRKGVSAVITLEHGIGVIADSFETCLSAKKALDIKWGAAKADGYDSDLAFKQYKSLATTEEKIQVVHEAGDIKSINQDAAKLYNGDFLNDFVYHAQMEPLNAVVSVAEDGLSAEAWVGSQSPDGARRAIARVLDIDFNAVNMHTCYLGGGFGRRSLSDYVEEATHLSNAVKKPVKLVWTREDDIQYGAFRPISLQRLSAGVDQNGDLLSWSHQIVGTGDGLLASGVKIPYYQIPNQKITLQSVDHGVRTKHWRSVGHGPNKYAIEAFIDQIARDQGVSPYAFRRNLLRDSPRELKVLDEVARMSNWQNKTPDGRAKGMAFGERSGALVAGVAEISVTTNGQIKVHKFWCAMDAGIVVQPDNARAQLEGGIVFGLGSVLRESITFSNGEVKQSNFHDYKIARMSDMPDLIETHIIPSSEDPAGVGEASTPVVGGAIANAFLALTGKTLTHMPFTAEKVQSILAG